MKPYTAALILITLLLQTTQALAQSGLSPMIFPASRDRVELIGVVEEFQFIAPQSIILMRVEGSGGASNQWRIQTSPAAELRRFGWTSTSIRPGELIQLVGQPRPNAPFELSLIELTRANGETLRPQTVSLLDEIPAGIWEPVPAQGYIQVNFDHFGFSTASFRVHQFTAQLDIPESGLESSSFELEFLAEDLLGSSSQLTQVLKSSAFFDASSYPLIRVVSTGVRRGSENRMEADVEIEIRDRLVRARLNIEIRKLEVHPQTGNLAIGFSGTARLNRSAFGMTEALPDVPDAVEVEFQMEFERIALPANEMSSDSSGMTLLPQDSTEGNRFPALNP